MRVCLSENANDVLPSVRLRRIHQTDVPPAVVMLTVTEASELAGATLAAGALGYVTKARAATDLVPALEAALAGRPFVSSPSRRPEPSGRPRVGRILRGQFLQLCLRVRMAQ